jgi:ribosomal protein S18 acetylase RimI-like enzyme
MNIIYSRTKEIDQNSLQELFLSAGWDSGKYPEELQKAINGSHRVISAWDGDTLVGLVNSISDGVMNAFIPYLLVLNEYRKLGIAGKLVDMLLDEYKDCSRKILIAENDAVDFYKKFGFKADRNSLPMLITHS